MRIFLLKIAVKFAKKKMTRDNINRLIDELYLRAKIREESRK